VIFILPPRSFSIVEISHAFQRLAALFAVSRQMAPIVIDVIVNDSSAYDFGGTKSR